MDTSQIVNYIIVFNLGYLIGIVAAWIIKPYENPINSEKITTNSTKSLKNIKPPKS